MNDALNHDRQSVPILRLGTRESPLAMAQAFETRKRLCEAHGWDEAQIELMPVRASGDKIQDRPLAEIGGKALWTKELDQWLAEGHIDAAVHSMKDVETQRPDAFQIGAILPRADRRDVLIGAGSIALIPQGATVGTSAPRRAAQLLSLRPDCRIVGLRGNVATRLAKLQAGEADVTFLAAAGLERLEKSGVGTALDGKDWVPAAAQGAIGIECRTDDRQTADWLAKIDHKPSRAEVEADRSFLAALGGTCHSPIAVDSHYVEGTISMRAVLFSPDGSENMERNVQFDCLDTSTVRQLGQEMLDTAPPGIRAYFGQS